MSFIDLVISAIGPSSLHTISLNHGGKREKGRTMVPSCVMEGCFRTSVVTTVKASYNEFRDFSPPKRNSQQIGFTKKPQPSVNFSCENLPRPQGFIHKSLVALSASFAVLLCSNHTANAGLLSGSSGIESVPGPDLPKFEFLSRFNEENQKKYAENDARFKDSPVLKELLEKTKLNKEKNRQAIQDKYCLRGAEWGVGDCSTEGMRPDEREAFIAMLKKKVGVEE